jgi:hypothetical protein
MLDVAGLVCGAFLLLAHFFAIIEAARDDKAGVGVLRECG